MGRMETVALSAGALRGWGLPALLTHSTPTLRDPGTDQAEDYPTDDHRDREPDECES
jgi:hypothetical protein